MLTWQQIPQCVVLGALIEAFLDEGYRVEISDQDGGGLHVYAMPDGAEMPKQGTGEYCKAWVKLEPANGARDFISDYSTNLEALIAPVQKVAESFGEP